MSSARERIALLVGEAALSLYPAAEDGAPLTSQPIWFGACAQDLRIAENWIGTETRPGGRKYPRRRAHVAQYTIDIGRVFQLQQADPEDFESGAGPYVLDVLWTDEDTGLWHRKTFYGVTPVQRSWGGNAADAATGDDQSWAAEYVVNESGTATPPAITPTVPLRVVWVGSDGRFDLYTHDATSGLFTIASSGITTGRATLVHTPSDMSGKFEVVFSSGSTVALRVTAAQVLEVGELVVGVPTQADMPYIEFVSGNARVAAVTLSKKLFVFSVDEVTALATASSGQFQIQANSALSLTLSAVKAGCLEVTESL